jgi:enoyl-CoA hydratase/carnithine racemase
VPTAEPVLTVSIEPPVARLTLNRPAKLNALNEEVRRALAGALHDLEERPDIRVLVLIGGGRAFSAGADLTSTAYPPVEGDWATRRHRTGTWQRVLEQLDRIPQVSVARLHGHVVGGAALLAAACDIRIAADDTVVRIPELAMTRAMLAAIGRTSPAMVAAWGDADHQQWSFTEAECREAARSYIQGSLKGDMRSR